MSATPASVDEHNGHYYIPSICIIAKYGELINHHTRIHSIEPATFECMYMIVSSRLIQLKPSYYKRIPKVSYTYPTILNPVFNLFPPRSKIILCTWEIHIDIIGVNTCPIWVPAPQTPVNLAILLTYLTASRKNYSSTLYVHGIDEAFNTH